jgi:hypothetical protein
VAVNKRINDHVAGTGIEGNDLVGGASRRNRRDVRDSSDVQCHATGCLIAKEQVVHMRDERRSTSSRRHVARAEIGYNRSTNSFGDHGTVSDL